MTNDVVATLGPEGTCSEIVLNAHHSRFERPITVNLHPSYELAAKAVCEGTARFVFVAAAFPELNVLVFDPATQLRIVDAFVAGTPALVIAALDPRCTAPETIAAVAAPVPVIRRTFSAAAIVPAWSNADAARLAARGETHAAFTTEPAALRAGLTIIRSFGSVPMAWVVMAKA